MIRYLNKDPIPHYKDGMYGGKFLPMHKGHLYCVETASKLCDRVYLILFSGGAWERLERELKDRDIYSVESRWKKVQEVANRFNNVYPVHVDVSECILPDGREDWDAEMPLVLAAIDTERFDAVFGSEPILYVPYFERACPWADYVVVDADRKEVPISATMIRHELSEKEAMKWLI